MTKWVTRRRGLGGVEAGFGAVETAVVTPVVVLVLLLVVAAGRVAKANLSVDAAAYAAARAASISRTSGQAQSSAQAMAELTLAQKGLACSSQSVHVDTSGFSLPAGSPAAIRVDLACTVGLGDLAVPGLPGVRTVTSSATSSLDTYRGRG